MRNPLQTLRHLAFPFLNLDAEPSIYIQSIFVGVHVGKVGSTPLVKMVKVLVETGDLTDAATCRKLLEKLQCCISVFHLAGARDLRSFSRETEEIKQL